MVWSHQYICCHHFVFLGTQESMSHITVTVVYVTEKQCHTVQVSIQGIYNSLVSKNIEFFDCKESIKNLHYHSTIQLP